VLGLRLLFFSTESILFDILEGLAAWPRYHLLRETT
jgi:hypothetical protein